jgi:hypothetical protein
MTSTTLLLVSVAVLVTAAIPVAFLLKDHLPAMVERWAGLEELEGRLYLLHAEIHDTKDALSRLTAQRNQQSNERSRLESDIRKIEKTIAEMAVQPPLFVHEVGEPHGGATRFVFNVAQEKASTAARQSNERIAVNPIWNHANVAEVWAASFEDARQLVETVFPFKLGFQKSLVRTPPGGGKSAGRT